MRSPLHFAGCAAIFLLAAHSLSAQRPVLSVEGKESSKVILQTLDIEVTINGMMATTTWTMKFKNNTSRILEGELTFPLPDGIDVSRYALDINGNLREAVPVEKAKGALVFESIERRKVDPGLLEKLEGNSFRTRIYPFNPGAKRTVLIGYDEQLTFDDQGLLKYNLPLALKEKLKDFNLRIRVIQSQKEPLIITDGDKTLKFDKRGNQFLAEKHFQNYIPKQNIAISIPKERNSAEVSMQRHGNKYYYIINSFVDGRDMPRKLPKQFTIAWDASLSSRNRNTKKELNLLREYLSAASDAQVNLVCFSNTILRNQQFLVSGGRSDALIESIKSLPLDGATNFGALDFNAMPGEEVLLFSDGHNTYGSENMIAGKKPVHCITSASTADFPALHFLCQKTGGRLINLNLHSANEAIRSLQSEPYRFLGVKKAEGHTEQFPSMSQEVKNSFSLAGVSSKPYGTLTLMFGYSNRVLLEKTVDLDYDIHETNELNVPKLWAQKKINEMNIRYDENKDEISRLGKKYSIVTRNSSLIVLETLNDYITYKIDPPAELQEEYGRMTKNRFQPQQSSENTSIRDAEAIMERLLGWYAPKPKPVPAAEKPVKRQPVARRVAQAAAIRDGVHGALAGTVYDEHREPLIGAIVQVFQGGVSQGGDQTDVDGKFSITPLRPGANYEVRVRYTSYKEIRITQVIISADRTTYQNFNMEGSGTELKEIVVKTYRAPLIKRDEPGTTTTITSEHIERMSTRSTADVASLAGGSYQSRNGGEVQIAGARSDGIKYIVDGLQANAGERSNRRTRSNEQAQGEDEPGSKPVQILLTASDKDYMKLIKQTPRPEQYEIYLQLRQEMAYQPVFFFRVGSYFLESGRKEAGVRILSNIAELGIEDYELFKMLGYKLREAGEYNAAVYCFKKVLNWRPAEPQSFRDYGLALEDAGYHQRALDTLYAAISFDYTRELKTMYAGYQEVLLTEINNLISKHKKQINIKSIPVNLTRPLPMDVRVVLNWNMNETDVDLWVTDPDGEKCLYNNPNTKMGGRLTDDFTQGFGPEQFQLKKAKSGIYTVEVNYYSDAVQKVAGPTTLLAEIYMHYGTPQEERQLITLQLDKANARQAFIGEFKF
jgi:tetratricopeptide (TPR) repeat protein